MVEIKFQTKVNNVGKQVVINRSILRLDNKAIFRYVHCPDCPHGTHTGPNEAHTWNLPSGDRRWFK